MDLYVRGLRPSKELKRLAGMLNGVPSVEIDILIKGGGRELRDVETRLKDLGVNAAYVPSANGDTNSGFYEDSRLRVDFRQRSVAAYGRGIRVTPIEFAILGFLLNPAGRLRSKREIYSHVKGGSSVPESTYDAWVRTHIKNLRDRIGNDPTIPRGMEDDATQTGGIVTKHSFGYVYVPLSKDHK